MNSRRTITLGLFAFVASACSKLELLAANVPASFGSYQRKANLAYGTLPHQRLDVYVPDTPAASRPMVVFWYGGRWTSGDKGDYRFVGAALASLGYVAVLPNYRHYPEVKMAGFMEDAAQATVWAFGRAAELGADPARFYLMGHSAGAHIAALVALDKRYLVAAGGGGRAAHRRLIGLSGPYDFLPLTEEDLKDMFGPPERYGESQPIDFVRRDAPPALLVHGLRDRSVWPKNSINLAAALEAKGVSVTLKLYPDLAHADTVAALSIPARGRAPTLADITAFVGKSRS